jgi:lysophospholipase L1-like esterase
VQFSPAKTKLQAHHVRTQKNTAESTMQALAIFQPSEVLSPGDANAPQLDRYGKRFLAQGDSWFSIGSLNLSKNSNLLFEMEFAQAHCAVNCARSGSTLRRMVDQMREPAFVALLSGRQRRAWDAILLSAGGNDLIDALQVHPGSALGQRILLTRAERGGDPAQASAYVSESGWQLFEQYLSANMDELVALRDAKADNRGIPIFMHSYHYPTVRNAPAGLGFGPWLLPAMLAYEVPPAVWPAMVCELFDRFRGLLQAMAQLGRNVQVFDSVAEVALTPALPGTTGESGDWVNEIHLTWQGYEKIAKPWAQRIEAF